jgi:hypothetical protein
MASTSARLKKIYYPIYQDTVRGCCEMTTKLTWLGWMGKKSRSKLGGKKLALNLAISGEQKDPIFGGNLEAASGFEPEVTPEFI